MCEVPCFHTPSHTLHVTHPLPQGWRGHVSGDPGPVVISPLLAAAAELLLAFPGHADVVVSVSRKTDASLWPALFSALGSPGALLEHLQVSVVCCGCVLSMQGVWYGG
jgi:hypothetical protein